LTKEGPNDTDLDLRSNIWIISDARCMDLNMIKSDKLIFLEYFLNFVTLRQPNLKYLILQDCFVRKTVGVYRFQMNRLDACLFVSSRSHFILLVIVDEMQSTAEPKASRS
ncbi:hypothetical protein ACJX0J_028969, partial [Zea mays]